MRRAARLRRALVLGGLICVGGWSAACHEEGDVHVNSLSIEGTSAVTTNQLKGVLETKATGWLPWAHKQYFDRAEFEADLGRIRRYYQDRGYPGARITSVDVALNDEGTAADLTVTIDEGEPVTVEAVRVEGFDELPAEAQAVFEDLPLQPGQPRDFDVVGASRQRILDGLRDRGYAYASVDAAERPGSGPSQVVVIFEGRAGPPARFGRITIEGLDRLDEQIVRRELTFDTGDAYDASRVTQSQRRLGRLQLLQFVNIDARPPEEAQPLDLPVRIVVTESPPRRLQLGVGYGSEGGVRGSAEWTHLNFLGGARELQAELKGSTIERGASLDFTQPYFYRPGLTLDLRTSVWQTLETTYRSRTLGGNAGVRYRFGGRERGANRAAGQTLRAGYVHEYLRYNITEDALEDLAGRDELIALGLDPTTGQGRGTRAALNVSLEHDATDALLDPRRGYALSAAFDHARAYLGGTFAYDEIVGEARGYLPIGERLVIAVRGRAGTLAGATDTDVPFSERYFLGGSSSLRGWGRYEVAPLANGLPVGGRTMLDTSAEVRVVATESFGLVFFMDAGNVWAGDWEARLGDLRYAAGPGLRYRTPVGAVRADLGIQMNPIPGLKVRGGPQTRRWRVHFSIGQAF
jgi:outer membrane protein assembly complex protein YaeT